MNEESKPQNEAKPDAPESADRAVNFFKPQSAHARADMKTIVAMVVIWAVAVFGFQALLCLLNEPTPEDNYGVFEQVWPLGADAGQEAKRQFCRVTLAVLGKNIVLSADEKSTLSLALSGTVYGLLSPDQQAQYTESVATDGKETAAKLATAAIGLGDEEFDPIMKELLPYSLVAVESATLSTAVQESIPGLMKKFLIHNRSVLTDFQFMGFPFHYWYTAQFLLILFVALCWIYAMFTDRNNAKHGFSEK